MREKLSLWLRLFEGQPEAVLEIARTALPLAYEAGFTDAKERARSAVNSVELEVFEEGTVEAVSATEDGIILSRTYPNGSVYLFGVTAAGAKRLRDFICRTYGLYQE